jgi:hypothetical protein
MVVEQVVVVVLVAGVCRTNEAGGHHQCPQQAHGDPLAGRIVSLMSRVERT